MSSLEKEMRLAVTTASMTGSGSQRKVMLVTSALPTLVPSGSLLHVKSVKFTGLKMGDIICVRDGSDISVCRFVKAKMLKSNTFLLVAKEGHDKKEPLPRDALLGIVEKVEHGGKIFNPSSRENPFKKFWGRLTEYGTHKPFGLSARK